MKNIYTIPAIPTRYAGVNFRSRLEARWAAFFDLLGWHWDYEPVDLNGWIPDFVIQGVKPIFVEVKPIFDFDQMLADEIEHKLGLPADGYDPRQWEEPHHGLICGATLIPCASGANDNDGVGWLWDCGFEPAPLFQVPGVPEKWGFCHASASYHDRMTGWYDGYIPDDGREEAKLLWREAGNEVQWRPPNRAAVRG